MGAGREAAIRPVWSPWLTTAVALAWLVALALAVDGVGLVLQLWLLSVGAAALAGLRMVRRPAAKKTEPTVDEVAAPLAEDHAEVSPRGSEPADDDSSGRGGTDGGESASRSAAEAELGPSPGRQPTIGSVPEAGALPKVWTATEVARMLGVPQEAVIEEMSSGHMPGNTIAGEWRVRAAALDDWLDGPYGERRVRS